jgi:hypothetical protein
MENRKALPLASGRMALPENDVGFAAEGTKTQISLRLSH